MENNFQNTPTVVSSQNVSSDAKIVLLALLMFIFGGLFSRMVTLDSFKSLKGSSIESQSTYTLTQDANKENESALIDGMKTILLPTLTFDEFQAEASKARVSNDVKNSNTSSEQNPGGDLYYNCNYLDGTSQQNVWFPSTEPMIVVVNNSGSVIGTCTTAPQQ